MAMQFFDQLAGPLSGLLPTENWYMRLIKYGIKCDVKISRDDHVKYETVRRGANFTNVLTTFGHFNVEMIDDMFITDGINVKLIDEYGRYDQQLVFDQLKLNTPFRPNVCTDLSIQIAENQYENHVAVLINLLRWWVIKGGDEKNQIFKGDDIFYDDGHVSMNYKQYLQTDVGGNLKPEMGREAYYQTFGENTTIGENFYMPNLVGFNERELELLRKYVSEIRCAHPSRLAFSSPQLVDTIMIPVNVRAPTAYPMGIHDERAEDLFRVISKYVFNNRCQSQFDLAYSIVVMSMYAPVPRAVEANAWVSPVNTMRLPKLGSVRGMLTVFTSGQAYTARPEAELTWPGFLQSPNRIFVHGIAASEALYGGMFEIVTAGGNLLTTLFETMGVTSATMATPWRIMQECAAYRFGKAFETTWDSLCGPDLMSGLLTNIPEQRDIEVSQLTDLTGYEFYRVEVRGVEQLRIRSTTVKPALFPVLSYGINDDRYYINKKKYQATMHYRPDLQALATCSANEVNKMMSIMRIAGMDCTVRDGMSGIMYKNWAANSNGQVMPIFNPHEVMGAYTMPIQHIVKRKANWYYLDNVRDEVKLGAEVDIKNYIVLANGKEVGRYNRTYTPVVRVPKAMLTTTATEVVIKTGASAAPYTYQDFLLAVTAMPVVDPTPALASVDIRRLQPSEEEVLTAGQQESSYIEEDDV